MRKFILCTLLVYALGAALLYAVTHAQPVEHGRLPNVDLVSWPLFTAECAQDYQVYWDGDGDVAVYGAESYLVPYYHKGTIVAPAGAAVEFRVHRSNRLDPVRNVSVWAPACPAAPVGYQLIKDWDFGTTGNVRNKADLSAEFQYHDQFNTIANGVRYGSMQSAESAETAIQQWSLGVLAPSYTQPIRPDTREFTSTSILLHVKPVNASQATVGPAWKKDAVDGSLTAKYSLPKGGSRLGKDLKWETRFRVRTPMPARGYWFAIWAAGTSWNDGPEMDVIESFSSNCEYGHCFAQSFHVDPVPMNATTRQVDYSEWWSGMKKSGMPSSESVLTNWHTLTWEYLRDDTYVVTMDDKVFQRGTLPWRDTHANVDTDMHFLIDGRAGIVDVWPIQEEVITVPASGIVFTYEIDYSRIWLRD